MRRISTILPVIIGCILVAMILVINHYRGNAIQYKKQREDLTQELSTATATITDLQNRQRDVAALDAKYTKELDNAKAKLADFEQCVRSGKCGLRLNATCPEVRKTAGTASMDDATIPRLADSAQRDYFTLKYRIEVSAKMIAGLQEFIGRQCK